MAGRAHRKVHGYIGCSVTERGIGLAQVAGRVTGADTSVLAWIPADEGSHSPAQRAREVLRDGGFRGARAVGCLAGDRLHFHRAVLSSAGAAPLGRAIRERIAREWGMDAESMCADVIPLPGDESRPDELHCIGLIASAADIEAQDQKLRALGLQPIAIDTVATALVRCIRHESGAPALVVEVGNKGQTFAIGVNGTPIFACSSPTTCVQSQVHSAAGPTRSADRSPGSLKGTADDLACEINGVLQFLSEEGLDHLLPESGLIVGGGVHHETFLDMVSDASGLGFAPPEELLLPSIAACLQRVPDRAALGDMIVPVCLAHYGREGGGCP